jgi:hypothetical protein
MEAGASTLASGSVPLASMDVQASGANDEFAETDERDGATIVTGAALLLLTGSLAVAFVSVRRRRA